jgi:hypothetical protein
MPAVAVAGRDGRSAARQALDRTFLLTGVLIWIIGATWLHSLPFREGMRRGLMCIVFPPAMLWFIARHLRDCLRPGLVYLGGLATVLAGFLLPTVPLPPAVSTALVVLWMIEISVMMGLIHGFLITRVGLQPFIVTLCGLLVYRGLARWLTDDQTQGFGRSHEGLRSLATGRPCTMSALILALGDRVDRVGIGSVGLRGGERAMSVRLAWCLAAIGVAALAVGGLHYLQDVASLPRGQATWAQQSMLSGRRDRIRLGIVWLNAVAVWRRRWKMLVADAVAAAGCAVLSWVLFRQREHRPARWTLVLGLGDRGGLDGRDRWCGVSSARNVARDRTRTALLGGLDDRGGEYSC